MARSFRLGLMVACLFAAIVQWGCAAWSATQRVTVGLNYPHASGETLTQSPHEHYQWVSSVSAHDARALVDDLDLFFLTDRPTRLTRWHTR